MLLVDILVGVGAALGTVGGIPQILKWVAKPKLEVLSAPQVNLSFTVGGTVVWWAVAISAERQDALITKIELTVTHRRNGDRRLLTWRGLEEVPLYIDVPESKPINYKKPSEVLAIKAATQSLSEVRIFFYDHEFHLDNEKKVEIAREHYNYLKGQGDNASTTMLQTKEFRQAAEFLSKDTFWKEGSYDLFIRLHVKRLKSPYEQKFRFTLSKEDIETLQKNSEKFEPFLRGQILEEDFKENWNWVSVNITPTK
jgi:hypothetical protein